MAVRPIQSMELLDLADHLAGRGRGPGKPRTIYLRRAISTGYYAFFSMLRQHAATRPHGADHDDLFEATKPLTLFYVDAVRSAVTSVDVLNSECEASYARFLGLAVGGVKIAKAR